jgi:soluble lytic murein transglycosylase-like protein
MDVAQQIVATAQQYGVDPALAIEVATAESGMNPNVGDSSAGAIGIFQLEPPTAAQLGVDPRDPLQNIDGGVRYLRQMLGKFPDVGAALGAYDWGPGNVAGALAKYGAGWLVHAPSETQSYVAKILGNLSSQYTVSAGPAPADTSGSFRASVSADAFSPAPVGFGGMLLLALGIFFLWTFEESF